MSPDAAGEFKHKRPQPDPDSNRLPALSFPGEVPPPPDSLEGPQDNLLDFTVSTSAAVGQLNSQQGLCQGIMHILDLTID